MIGDLVTRPVIVAPMAGGVGTTALVAAAADAGAVGFLPAGYKTAQATRADIDAVQAVTNAPFGVNVFVPGSPAADAGALSGYVDSLAVDAAALGTASGTPTWDDDDWQAKIADLTSRPVPIVSFTFGCPEPGIIAALRSAGTSVWVTVTDEREAGIAVRAGADCLCVQGSEAGAHRGTFANRPGSDTGVLDL
ncbi:MAG: nitronate monooxygenase, partial [Streptosporangiaceae bacterium]